MKTNKACPICNPSGHIVAFDHIEAHDVIMTCWLCNGTHTVLVDNAPDVPDDQIRQSGPHCLLTSQQYLAMQAIRIDITDLYIDLGQPSLI